MFRPLLMPSTKPLKKRRLKKPLRWLPPNSIERQYRSSLLKINATLRDLTQTILIPRLEGIAQYANMRRPNLNIDGVRSDSWSDDIDSIIKQIKSSLTKQVGDLALLGQNIGNQISSWNETQFQKTIRSVFGTNIFVQEPWLQDEIKAFARQNANLIQGMTDRATGQIDTLVTQGIQRGTRIEDLASQISDRFDVTDKQAKLIARDQTSKLNGQLTQLRQKSAGITKYVWSTSSDERVRPEHARLNGQVFSWDSPPSVGNPGQDYNCRCIGQPYFEPEDES